MYHLKKVFSGVYIRKGARSFGGITERKKEKKKERKKERIEYVLCLSTAINF